jgi:hypothetical protein
MIFLYISFSERWNEYFYVHIVPYLFVTHSLVGNSKVLIYYVFVIVIRNIKYIDINF